jgi:hypothetical protein
VTVLTATSMELSPNIDCNAHAIARHDLKLGTKLLHMLASPCRHLVVAICMLLLVYCVPLLVVVLMAVCTPCRVCMFFCVRCVCLIVCVCCCVRVTSCLLSTVRHQSQPPLCSCCDASVAAL